jgi:hypothetical protein
MDNHTFHITIIVVLIVTILIMVAYGEEKRMTTCRLASQILYNKQRICVFVGANNTQYREYLPYDAGECPRQYECPYRPNEKPFQLKNVIKSIRDQF